MDTSLSSGTIRRMKKILTIACFALISCATPQLIPGTIFSEAQRACEVYAKQHELKDACQTLDQLLPFAEALLQAQEEPDAGAVDAESDAPEPLGSALEGEDALLLLHRMQL